VTKKFAQSVNLISNIISKLFGTPTVAGNPVSKIYYTIPIAGYVRIVVYNSMGQTVKELVNEFKGIGSHTAEFDGTGLSSGIYYYKISFGSFNAVRKMVLIK